MGCYLSMLAPNFFETQKTFKLKAKNLAYSCDVVVQGLKSGDELMFTAQGKVRFAIIKSNIEIKSIYKISRDEMRLENYCINIPQKNWRETYEREHDQSTFKYSTAKARCLIDVDNKNIIDPLYYIFECLAITSSLKDEETKYLFVSSKVKKVESQRSPKSTKIKIDGSPKLEIIRQEDKTQIFFLPLKIKMNIDFISLKT